MIFHEYGSEMGFGWEHRYEHHIQVIPTIYKSRSGTQVQAYKYAVTSAEHMDTDQFPSAKFTYDLAPRFCPVLPVPLSVFLLLLRSLE